jgi:hypothetical protein
MWICSECTYKNADDSRLECKLCHAEGPDSDLETLDHGTLDIPGEWSGVKVKDSCVIK